MSSDSENSQVNYDRLSARVQHTARYSSPEAGSDHATDNDFMEVGGQFGGTEWEPYPYHLELSESESNDPQTTLHTGNQPPINAYSTDDSRPPPRVSSTLPPRTLIRSHLGPYIHSSEYRRSRSERRSQQRRRLRSRQRSQSSRESDENPRSDLTIGYSPERGRNNENNCGTTPTPAFSPSRTPSHHSRETDEDGARGAEPQSPHPFSEYDRYNPDRWRITLSGLEEQFSSRE
ncbi:unnamed protein product [Periconia digitata]|uniref:Uncharacterized protein n=1 Tax=Periconia digitata TaxID=1303443 RepID=A0A9W4XZ89_9PLEO|nr:unnamed protein product [Periconia digitata]